MAGRYSEENPTQVELDRARSRLEEFETKHRGKSRMARLRHANPKHPILLGMAFTLMAGVSLLLFAVGLAVLPFVSDDIARTFATLPGINLLPMAMVGLSLASGMLYGVLYGLALGQGGQSAFLPSVLKEQNRLRSDVQRLTVAQDVQKRLTNTPAPARTRRY